eukprot:comp11401_c0_seq1/m.5787 comp11401_c0_seq1/g.5787  ORF comp11401_c0_seq1/g.5787 comp11401_c0_seq1/m.5787 type:complete len:183 (-) comp11401_c0_seq1:834-1382(-)
MGNAFRKQQPLTPEQLEEYMGNTFFTRNEVLRIYHRFHELSGGKAYLMLEDAIFCTELQANPFARRICQMFSEDRTGDLSFEDFLDMLSVFSDKATQDVKAMCLFRLYDFNEDGFLCKSDLQALLRVLYKGYLKDDEIECIAMLVLEEASIDGDGRLSYVEFENVLARCPQFARGVYITSCY